MLWTGRPLRRVVFHSSDWYAIPFSLLWGGFAIFWEWGVTGHGGIGSAPTFMELWGIPFVLIGQYMIWGRFLYTAWRKGRTHYAVTTKRIVVVTSGATRKVTSGDLQLLDVVSLTTRRDGVGTVEFSPEPDVPTSYRGATRRRGGPQLNIDLGRLAFYDIPDARRVYETIQSERDTIRRQYGQGSPLHMR